jgi:hypothetical protein
MRSTRRTQIVVSSVSSSTLYEPTCSRLITGPVLQKITGHRSLHTLTEHTPDPAPRRSGPGMKTRTPRLGVDGEAER